MLQEFPFIPQEPPCAHNPTAAELQETLQSPDPDEHIHVDLAQIDDVLAAIGQSTDIDPSSLAFDDVPQSWEEAQCS